MVEVLIVDDLKSARDLIRNILASDPHIHICGMADDGNTAIEMVKKLHPHLVVLDSHLKQTSGFTVAEEIMRVRPTPIVMVAAASDAANPPAAFVCLRGSGTSFRRGTFSDGEPILRSPPHSFVK